MKIFENDSITYINYLAFLSILTKSFPKKFLTSFFLFNIKALLQLKLDQCDRFLIGTAGKGFIVWDFGKESRIGDGAIYLPLPHGVRNISTKMMTSNSMMISSKLDYSVAGVRYIFILRTNTHKTEKQFTESGIIGVP